jgi:hypothetical protein
LLVFVLNKHNEVLMPCSTRKAKLLLRSNRAKVVRKLPFTIKLLYGCSGYKQDLSLGIDTGSSKIGSAVVNKEGKVIYISEIEIRNDISKKMKQRSEYRRLRRNRKTRYRKARFLNRKNSIRKDRFSPTMTSKINSHIKEIEFVRSILPIAKLIIETGTFDPHALKNPEVLVNKYLYQKGTNYGFANSRAYVLDRDNHICQHCKGKSKDKRLEVHHIIFRSNGGSDDPLNLITLCETCHKKLHSQELMLKLKGKVKGNLLHATQMNSIRVQLLKKYPEVIETFGYITKEHRFLYNLPKEHYIDACLIASEGQPIHLLDSNALLSKRCIAKGDYQQTKGVRSEKVIPTGKIQGFRKFDKVKYLEKEYFIKGRMSTGYCKLMNIQGEEIKLKPIPKFSKMSRIGARKSWLMVA